MLVAGPTPPQGYAAYLGRAWELLDWIRRVRPAQDEAHQRLMQVLMAAPERIARASTRRGCAFRGCSRPLAIPGRCDHRGTANLFGQLHRDLWGCEPGAISQVLEDEKYSPLYALALQGLCLPHGAALCARMERTIAAMEDADLRCGWFSVDRGLVGVVLGPCGGVLASTDRPLSSQDAVQRWAAQAHLGGCGHPDPGPLCRPDGASS